MNILVFTNNYIPHIGGVARSVYLFTRAFRAFGHRTVIVAPSDKKAPSYEPDVIRIPSVQNVTTNNFPISLPVPGYLNTTLADYRADVIHSHHPFILGDTAIRYAAKYDAPIVFTYHTLYEQYVHYIGSNSPTLRQFVKELTTAYCNLCDHIIAPSNSIASILPQQGVTSPVSVVPTGVHSSFFIPGNGNQFRQKRHIPSNAFVVGHVGRLALEKNLIFLSKAVAEFLQQYPTTHFLIIGEGDQQENVKRIFSQAGVLSRVHFAGFRRGKELIDAYSSLDVFAFSSLTETQGMVLLEAMATGTPVVALDAPGTRDVINNNKNGWVISSRSTTDFSLALANIMNLSDKERLRVRKAARQTALQYTIENSANATLSIYQNLASRKHTTTEDIEDKSNAWKAAWRQVNIELELVSIRAQAMGNALQQPKDYK